MTDVLGDWTPLQHRDLTPSLEGAYVRISGVSVVSDKQFTVEGLVDEVEDGAYIYVHSRADDGVVTCTTVDIDYLALAEELQIAYLPGFAVAYADLDEALRGDHHVSVNGPES